MTNSGVPPEDNNYISELIWGDFEDICGKFKKAAAQKQTALEQTEGVQITTEQVKEMLGYLEKYIELSPHTVMEDMGYGKLDEILTYLHTFLTS